MTCRRAGEAARLQAVAQVQRHLATLGALLGAAGQLQARAGALLPEDGQHGQWAGHEDAGQVHRYDFKIYLVYYIILGINNIEPHLK